MPHEEKSHVGMTACYFCGADKDILLDTRLKKSLVRKAIYDMEPCDKCKADQAQGITLMRVEDSWDGKGLPNCLGWCVVKEEAVERMFNEDMAAGLKKSRKGFMANEAWVKMGLPT